MRHIEFIHNEHFENNYHRVAPPNALRHFIDFFWETNFDSLWEKHPTGFSDAQFPNIGYTYIINLGNSFTMHVEDKPFKTKTDSFLPRYHAIECFHKPGNHLFGIKFRISPILFEKKINFAEYRGQFYPLSYLLEQSVIDDLKKLKTFTARVQYLSSYFIAQLKQQDASWQAVHLVSQLLEDCYQQNNFSISLENEAAKNKITVRTLQRYFEACTGISSKKALQVMRIRKAIMQIITAPDRFHYSTYGYYDYSHFHKSIKKFLTIGEQSSHLPILSLIQTIKT
ncbi:MAG: hypothetical protein R2796_10915 [Chitinophagaceae bacterium]|nr:hypothetical protein [Chitinophagaceae bacterium]MCB0740414.1 hypothetical protein [Chitinophagaceae bacterium]